jgi:hypothetical protein
MKRAFRSAAAGSIVCLLLPAPSLADSETSPNVESVTVETGNALPGIWRFPPHERRSDWSQKGSDVVATFAAMGPEKYCRIGHATFGYTFNCLEIAERFPRAKLIADAQVQLSWAVLFGVPGCRWTFQGRLRSGTELSGHLGMRCGMVLREKPEPMTITKMALSEKTPDAAGQSAFLKRLLEEMANGRVTEPYAQPRFISSDPAVKPLPDEVQTQLLRFLTPDTLRSLGNITATIYIADYSPIVGWRYDQASPVYSGKRSGIYAVEFENGERLCALHRRPDGVLDQFQCI